jgi:hypothetical protein
MPIPNIARQQKEQKIAPQIRTEYHNLSLTITQDDVDTSGAYIQDISFDNRYYEQPAIIMGITSASYKDADTGNMYKTHFISTLKEYLVSPSSDLFVGAKVFIRPDVLPNKLTYPITGSISLIVVGRGTEQYLGALEDAIPMLPEDATIHDDDKELELDAPLSPTSLVLTTGLYYDSTDKKQSYYGYIKATWDAVLHNDLQGYESDISEGDNVHYDGLPDPKFNSAIYMNWMGLKRNTIYYIRVRAVDLHGNVSDWTENHITTDVEGTVNPPTAVTIGEQPPLGVVVSWVASTTSTVILYEVNMASVLHGNSAPDFSASVKVAEIAGTTYIKTALDTTKDYYFWIRAVSALGNYSVWVASSGQQPHLITDTTVQAASLLNALAANSVGATNIQAGAVTANKIATGALLTYNATIVNRLAKNDLVFTSTKGGSYAYVTWSGGVNLVKYSGGSWSTITCTINSGNYSFNSQAIYYLYFVPNVDGDGEPIAGSYSLSISTSYPTNQYSIIVGYVNCRYVNSEWTADVVPVGSTGTIINGDHLITGSVTANQIAAGTITADKLYVTQLSAISANVGTITSGTIIGTTIKTSANNKRIELIDSDYIMFYNASGSQGGELYYAAGEELLLLSYYNLRVEALGNLVIQSINKGIDLYPHGSYYVTMKGNVFMETAKYIYWESASGCYLYASGNHIYWYNGSTSVQLD